jgi:hypothetical protein
MMATTTDRERPLFPFRVFSMQSNGIGVMHACAAHRLRQHMQSKCWQTLRVCRRTCTRSFAAGSKRLTRASH